MGAFETLWRWLEPSLVETSVYHCRDCHWEFGSNERVCPECGGEVQVVTKPVPPIDWDAY